MNFQLRVNINEIMHGQQLFHRIPNQNKYIIIKKAIYKYTENKQALVCLSLWIQPSLLLSILLLKSRDRPVIAVGTKHPVNSDFHVTF